MGVAAVIMNCSSGNGPDANGDDGSGGGAQTGSLQISLEGLPSGLAGDVLVTGPNSYSRVVSQDTTLTHLAAGTYTVEPRVTSTLFRKYRGRMDSIAVRTAQAAITLLYTLQEAKVQFTMQGRSAPNAFWTYVASQETQSHFAGNDYICAGLGYSIRDSLDEELGHGSVQLLQGLTAPRQGVGFITPPTNIDGFSFDVPGDFWYTMGTPLTVYVDWQDTTWRPGPAAPGCGVLTGAGYAWTNRIAPIGPIPRDTVRIAGVGPERFEQLLTWDPLVLFYAIPTLRRATSLDPGQFHDGWYECDLELTHEWEAFTEPRFTGRSTNGTISLINNSGFTWTLVARWVNYIADAEGPLDTLVLSPGASKVWSGTGPADGGCTVMQPIQTYRP